MPGWVTVFGWVNRTRRRASHRGLLSVSPLSMAGWNEYPVKAGGVNRHRVIQQPASMVLQCGAGAWLYGLANGRLAPTCGKQWCIWGCSRRCTILQLDHYFTFTVAFRREWKINTWYEGLTMTTHVVNLPLADLCWLSAGRHQSRTSWTDYICQASSVMNFMARLHLPGFISCKQYTEH